MGGGYAAATMAQLRERRKEILGIARRHGVYDVRVFGSVARRDARPDSDVDLLVDAEPDRDLLDIGEFLEEASELPGGFGVQVRSEATPL